MLGVVAIGRNEGERLRRCLESATRDCDRVVYVDSGSSDDSVSLAKSFGAIVVSLDMSKPFSAARGRNEGYHALMAAWPSTRFVQFIDGDCELAEHWLTKSQQALSANESLAAVCGRRRERYPDATIYNRLCDIEWDTPIGKAKSCGGDAAYRVEAIEQVGGFDDTVIAAEDDEVCVRLRRQGWKIERINAEMTLHDAAMTRFTQWWRRAVRAGHGFAQGFAMHGEPPEKHFAKPLRSCLIWGGAFPLVAISLAWVTGGISLVMLFTGYALLLIKTARSMRSRGLTTPLSMLYAANCVLSKFPGLIGIAKYHWRRLLGSGTRIIEYK